MDFYRNYHLWHILRDDTYYVIKNGSQVMSMGKFGPIHSTQFWLGYLSVSFFFSDTLYSHSHYRCHHHYQVCRTVELEHHKGPCRCSCHLSHGDCSPAQVLTDCHCDYRHYCNGLLAIFFCTESGGRTWNIILTLHISQVFSASQCRCTCPHTANAAKFSCTLDRFLHLLIIIVIALIIIIITLIIMANSSIDSVNCQREDLGRSPLLLRLPTPLPPWSPAGVQVICFSYVFVQFFVVYFLILPTPVPPWSPAGVVVILSFTSFFCKMQFFLWSKSIF